MKDKLKQYIKNENMKKYLQGEILKLKTQAEKTTSVISDIKSGGNSRHDDLYVSFIEKKEKFENELYKIEVEQNKIISAILSLSDSEQKQILLMRYVEGRSWASVSFKLNMAVETAIRKHNKAIRNLKLPM